MHSVHMCVPGESFVNLHSHASMFNDIDVDPRLIPRKENTVHGLEVRKIY